MKQSSSIRKEEAAPAERFDRLSQKAHSDEQVRKIKTLLYAALGFLVVVDFFVHREHAAFGWDSIPGFSAFYGLIAAALIIFISKFLGVGLMKPENYYGGQHD